MFIRQKFRSKNGKRHAYWALVESYRTERGPRQRVISWLGKLDEEGRLGVQQIASEAIRPFAEDPIKGQVQLSFLEEPKPRYVKVDAQAVRVEDCRKFGAPWLALKLIEKLNLKSLLDRLIPSGRESVPWSVTVLLLLIARFCEPSSELYIAEQWLPKTALPTLLGVPQERVDDNRLYRGLDQLLPHKDEIEKHLKERLGELFKIEFDLLLYDVTSTFFEGQAAANPKAQRGYSRDKRSDCKQVCIGLVVTRCGMPLGYKVFSGNTADVTTVEEIVETMESRYGKADRVWVMDRGMVSEHNLQFLRDGDRRYIIGTPKSMLRKFEAELLKKDWHTVREGLEVKLCSRDDLAKGELFVMCRSADRRKKDEAILRRSEDKIEARLKSMTKRCQTQKRDVQKVEREIGKLLGRNTRASKLFDVQVEERESGGAEIAWSKIKNNTDWATLSAGCYLLRTNVQDWSDEELWKAYVQLSEAESAFRIHKTDLQLRPIWHQKEDRVDAHLLVCFLSYVMWKTLGGLCEQAGLGTEPRRIVDELSEIRSMDVVLPTHEGIELRQPCISRPSEHQAILLDRLGLDLPKRLRQMEM